MITLMLFIASKLFKTNKDDITLLIMASIVIDGVAIYALIDKTINHFIK